MLLLNTGHGQLTALETGIVQVQWIQMHQYGISGDPRSIVSLIPRLVVVMVVDEAAHEHFSDSETIKLEYDKRKIS